MSGLRSWLFVPADSERKIAKAQQSGADVLILDLEDSVAPERKAVARQMARDAITARPAGEPAIYVRVNAWDSGLTVADLAGVLAAGPDGVLLPKADAAGVARLTITLDALEVRDGLPAGATAIATVATETAAAVLGLAGRPAEPQSPRLAGMMWGAEDLSAALGASTKRDARGDYLGPFALSRDLCLLTARAAGVLPIDTVYPDFRDLAGFEAEVKLARSIGFGAKAAIHPDQVPVINAVFAPTEAELAWARKVMAAFAAAPDAGVLSLDGEMIDRPHLRLAQRLLSSS